MSVEFVDSNILIYSYTENDRKYGKALELIESLWVSKSGAVSTQVLSEFYSVVTRKALLSHKLALEALEDLKQWSVHCLSSSDVIGAARLQQKSRISFWDAMIVTSAIEIGARVLWTEDLNDGQRFDSVVIRNPFK